MSEDKENFSSDLLLDIDMDEDHTNYSKIRLGRKKVNLAWSLIANKMKEMIKGSESKSIQQKDPQNYQLFNENNPQSNQEYYTQNYQSLKERRKQELKKKLYYLLFFSWMIFITAIIQILVIPSENMNIWLKVTLEIISYFTALLAMYCIHKNIKKLKPKWILICAGIILGVLFLIIWILDITDSVNFSKYI